MQRIFKDICHIVTSDSDTTELDHGEHSRTEDHTPKKSRGPIPYGDSIPLVGECLFPFQDNSDGLILREQHQTLSGLTDLKRKRESPDR